MFILACFAGTIVIVMVSMEAGYRAGRIAHHHSRLEKESPVSAIEGSVLALLAFILAFTFGIASEDISRRLASIFLRDADGRRPVYGGTRKFQADPHWRDLVLFYEYFHGDNGAGLGASHQTGWTGVVARLMHPFATSTAAQFLELGKAAAGIEIESDAETKGVAELGAKR